MTPALTSPLPLQDLAVAHNPLTNAIQWWREAFPQQPLVGSHMWVCSHSGTVSGEP